MWNISERAQRKAREAMDKKKDRGAGKVVNFCVAASTMILCESGLKRITDVTSEDRVWDGGNWVRHGGVVSRGRKKAMTYGGLTATPEHVVYTTTGPKPFLVAARNGDTLLASGDGAAPVELDVVPAKPGYGHTLDEDVREAMNTGLYFYPNCDYRDRYDTDTMELEEVYDIVDAGPNNRFTANGVLVHNSSSYGGQAASLQRKIESDTGHQVPIEMVEAMLQAIVDRAPDADKWFHEMEKKPLTSGIIRAASGRLRHCSAFGAEGDYLSDRTKDSIINALGRECRNYCMQESVAAVAARALSATLAFKRMFNLQGGVCVCLYDSLVVHCPYEERMIWGKALELYMHLANGWVYGDNLLRYAIDLEYNTGWSTHSPDHEENARLKDPEWMPTPAHLRHVEDYLDAKIALYTKFPVLSVYNRQDLTGKPFNYIG